MLSSNTPPGTPETPKSPESPESPESLESSSPVQAIVPVADDGSAPGPGQRQLMLTKQGRRLVFRYTVGQEASFLKGIRVLVSSPGSQINWFDAAVLSHQMGQSLSQDIAQRKRA